MPVIDVQVHPFDRNHPGRPWASPSHGLESASGEEMVAAMNSVGVDGAIMVSSFSAYEYDPSYALEVYHTYPDKFRVVTPVDATDPAIDDVVAKWATTQGARGIRIRMREGLPMDADHPGLNRAFAAAGRHGLPVNLLCWGILDKGLPHIRQHPDTIIVIDHLGLLQPARPPVPADVWADLPKLLSLAQYANVQREDQRRLHDVAPSIPVRRYLGAGATGYRCVRAGSLHVGHRLDADDRHADLRAGRCAVPQHQSPVGKRQSEAHGRYVAEGLQVVDATATMLMGPDQRGDAPPSPSHRSSTRR